MIKKALLIAAVIVFTQSLIGQVNRSFTKTDHRTAPYEWKADNAKSGVLESLTENFEGYDDFTLDFSPWTTADVDGSGTYGIIDHDFPHSGEPMAYIVFNPDNVDPSMGDDVNIQAHSGSKFAACFASLDPPNDDWIITPAINLGSNSSLSFWVKSYTEQYGLERYKVGISTTDNNPSSFTIISGDNYLEAPATAWQQKQYDLSAYDGMQVYVGIQCVSDDAFLFMLDDLDVNSEATGGTLYGKVTDALTGEPVPDALVSVAGLSDYTDENGDYSISGIPAGTLNANFTATPTSGTAPLQVQFTDLSSENSHTVTASHEGYVDYSNSQVVIPDGGSLELAISLSPDLAEGQMRFVLTWGELPADLDSHLKTPEIEGSTYHIYYSNHGSADSPPYAILDIDDIISYGPETTTIYDLFTGEYHYYIYNYSGSPDIVTSGAVVQIFNDNGMLYNLQIPTVGTGRYWDVCTVNGTTGAVNIINQITENEPGGKSFDIMPPKTPHMNRDIVSWNWNFGDGASSTLQNPEHTYTNNGTYTVTLTVSDGTISKTEIKTDMIVVGPDGINDVEENPVNIYPNPVQDQLKIEAENVILSVGIYNMSGQKVAFKTNASKVLQMNLRDLTNGTYILVITTEKGIRQMKINRVN